MGYEAGWATGVSAWLDDPCSKPSEDDQQAYQRIRETVWQANQSASSEFWLGFQEGIQQEFGIIL